jgi:hypothetical protein
MHLLPVLAVWAAHTPYRAALCVVLLALCSTFWHSRQYRCLKEMRLLLHPSGLAQLEMLSPAGRHLEAVQILPTFSDLGCLIVLVWQREGEMRLQRLALSRDGFSAAAWRDVRRWLRWSGRGLAGD